MSINLFDGIFLITMLGATLISFKKGMMRELLGLLGIGVGFLAAGRYAPNVAEVVKPLLPDEKTSALLGFILIMMAGYFLGRFLAGFGGMVLPFPQSILGRLIGGVVGFAKGVVFSLAIYWVVDQYIPPFQDELGSSLVGRELGRLFSMMENLNLI